MSLVTEDMGLSRPPNSGKIQPDNNGEYLHVCKANVRVRELRGEGPAVPVAGRCEGPLFKEVLQRAAENAGAAQQREKDAGDEALRYMRKLDDGPAFRTTPPEILFARVFEAGVCEHAREGAGSLSCGWRLLAVGGNAPGRIRSGQVERTTARGAPRKLRISYRHHPRGTSAGSSLPEPILHKSASSRAGDTRRKYQTRGTRFAGSHEETLGHQEEAFQWR